MTRAIPRWLLFYWLAAYLAAHVAFICSYYHLRGLTLAPARSVIPVGIAAGLTWLAIAPLAMKPTWRAVRTVVSAVTADLGRNRAAIAAGLVVVAWTRIPAPDWFRPGVAAAVGFLLVNGVGIVLLVLLADRAASSPIITRLARRLERLIVIAPIPVLLFVTAAWCFIASLAICYGILRPIPHIWDEASYFFQARLFADGRLAGVAAPAGLGPLVRTYFVLDDVRSYSVLPPGWPGALAVGVAAGATWLVNPLLAAGCAPLLYAFVSALWGRVRARYALLLLCACPFFLFLSASLMSHTFSLFATLLAALGFVRGRDSPTLSCVGGLGLALLFLTRPLEGALLGLVLAGLHVRSAMLTRRWLLRTPLFLVAIAGPACWMAFNGAVGSGPFDVPVDRYFHTVLGTENGLGFGPDRGLETWFHHLGPGHTPLEAWFNLQFNLHSANEKLWGWPGGAMLVLALGLADRRRPRTPRAVLLFCVVLVGAYMLYWYHGECMGPRFYFVLLPAIVLLTYKGLAVLGRATETSGTAIALLVIPLTLIVHVPTYGLTYYRNARGISESARDELADPPRRPAIVLVDDAPPHHYFFCAAPLNDSALSNDVIYALDRRDLHDEARLRREFPARWIYRFQDGAWHLVSAPDAGSRQSSVSEDGVTGTTR